MTKYEIARLFRDGFVAGVGATVAWDDKACEHWRAGYMAGYRLREERHKALNEHLVSIGQEPMGVVSVCR